MKSKIFPLILFIIFTTIFFIFYKGLQNSNIYIPENNIEKKIPSFEVKKFASNEIENSDQIFEHNKFYLLNIWASWCMPCRDEHPFIMSLNGNDRLEIIGLNYKDNDKKAKKFINDYGNPFSKILLDKDGTKAIEWGAYGVPETFLIFENKIIKKYIGPLNSESILEIKNFIK